MKKIENEFINYNIKGINAHPSFHTSMEQVYYDKPKGKRLRLGLASLILIISIAIITPLALVIKFITAPCGSADSSYENEMDMKLMEKYFSLEIDGKSYELVSKEPYKANAEAYMILAIDDLSLEIFKIKDNEKLLGVSFVSENIYLYKLKEE